jgi:asparagine synthase (glutamine-hydrolysing)
MPAMCGIAGILDFSGRPVERALLLAMLGRIAHRGPDDGGWMEDDGSAIREGSREPGVPASSRVLPRACPSSPRIALGHQRLAITDLSPAGHQPMSRGDGRWWITFNGAIFNAPELKRELEESGERFTTATDTEVLLAAYARWGAAALPRLNGMWAFAVWDAERRELFCSRDRYAIKPFYYTISGDRFAFASEPKALRPVRPAAPDRESLAGYLTVGSRIPDGDASVYAGYRILPAGSLLRAGAGGIRVERWYDLEERVARVDPPASLPEAAGRLRELLSDAVAVRLRADVPVGLLLSGGVDSSGIGGILAANHRNAFPGPAISLRYPGRPDIDESSYSDAVLRATGFSGDYVEPSPEDFDRELDDFVASVDGLPLGSGGLAQRLLYRRARARGFVVVLVGQGSDELFGGYEPWDVHVTQLWNRGRRATALGEGFLSGRRRWGVLKGLRHTLGVVRSARHPLPCRCAVDGTLQDHQRHLLMLDYLPAILDDEDRNSMASGVESRLPFLDHRVVELARSLPGEWLCRGGWTKVVLRRALAGLVPEVVLRRRHKLGLPGPLQRREDALPEDGVLPDSVRAARRRLAESGWFDPRSLPDERLARDPGVGLRLRFLDAWARRCLDAPPDVRLDAGPEGRAAFG